MGYRPSLFAPICRKNANVPVTKTVRARAIGTDHALRRCPCHVHARLGRGGRGNQDQVPRPSTDFWEIWQRFAKPEIRPEVSLHPVEMSSYIWDGTSNRASCADAKIKSSHSPASTATTRAVPHLWTPMRTLAARQVVVHAQCSLSSLDSSHM